MLCYTGDECYVSLSNEVTLRTECCVTLSTECCSTLRTEVTQWILGDILKIRGYTEESGVH